MKRMVGIVIGVLWLGLAFGAWRLASTGWERGATDIGFWFTVVTLLLLIAAISAVVGTWIHTRGSERHPAH